MSGGSASGASSGSGRAARSRGAGQSRAVEVRRILRSALGAAPPLPRGRRHASESMDAMPEWMVETREIRTRQSCMGRLMEWTPAPDGTAMQSRRC